MVNYEPLISGTASTKVQAIVAQQLGKAWSKGAPATGLVLPWAGLRHCMTLTKTGKPNNDLCILYERRIWPHLILNFLRLCSTRWITMKRPVVGGWCCLQVNSGFWICGCEPFECCGKRVTYWNFPRHDRNHSYSSYYHCSLFICSESMQCITGWWFGTCFIFPYIGNF